MPYTTDIREQNAKHLAARAVMAYRAGFPVEIISISGEAAQRAESSATGRNFVTPTAGMRSCCAVVSLSYT